MGHLKKTQQTVNKEVINKTHALIKLGAITAGTQLVTSAIHKFAQHPVVLFSLGMAVGVYANRNRKQIIASASYLAERGKNFIMKEDADNEIDTV